MNPGLQAAVLSVASVLSLSLVLVLCLRCRRRKPKIIHEETQIYNPQVFSRGGSRFAVVRSKTVTRANQMSPASHGEPAAPAAHDYSDEAEKNGVYIVPYREPSPGEYQNKESILEQEARLEDAVYGNIDPKAEEQHFSDSDYENSEFLADQEEEEPDYENLAG